MRAFPHEVVPPTSESSLDDLLSCAVTEGRAKKTHDSPSWSFAAGCDLPPGHASSPPNGDSHSNRQSEAPIRALTPIEMPRRPSEKEMARCTNPGAGPYFCCFSRRLFSIRIVVLFPYPRQPPSEQKRNQDRCKSPMKDLVGEGHFPAGGSFFRSRAGPARERRRATGEM